MHMWEECEASQKVWSLAVVEVPVLSTTAQPYWAPRIRVHARLWKLNYFTHKNLKRSYVAISHRSSIQLARSVSPSDKIFKASMETISPPVVLPDRTVESSTMDSPKTNVTDVPVRPDSKNSSDRDSGYGSTVGTPDKRGSQAPSSDRIEGSQVCRKLPIPFQLAGPANLGRFEKDVDKATIDRFKDVLELIEGPLLSYMQRSRLRYRPMAIRLMVLGKSEEDAKPWIVVLCNEDQSKRVKRFFEKKLAKDLCRPQDLTLPSFDILIVNQPLRTKTKTEVYGGVSSQNVDPPTPTSCGTIIKLVTAEQTRFATLGGIIKVTSSSGDYALFGMTAGHIAELETPDDCEDESEWDENKHEEISSDDESEPDTTENNDIFFDTHDALHRVISPVEASPSAKPSLEVPDTWVKLGNALPKTWDSKHQRNYDWALIENLDQRYYRQNLVSGQDLQYGQGLKEPSEGRANFQKAQSIVMISGSQVLKRGKLSSLPSMLLLAPGRKFVQAYTLALDDGSGTI
jgi:hypothetical protein